MQSPCNRYSFLQPGLFSNTFTRVKPELISLKPTQIKSHPSHSSLSIKIKSKFLTVVYNPLWDLFHNLLCLPHLSPTLTCPPHRPSAPILLDYLQLCKHSTLILGSGFWICTICLEYPHPTSPANPSVAIQIQLKGLLNCKAFLHPHHWPITCKIDYFFLSTFPFPFTCFHCIDHTVLYSWVLLLLSVWLPVMQQSRCCIILLRNLSCLL